jgi:hypothetical protein
VVELESGPFRVLRRQTNRLGSGLEARMPALEIPAQLLECELGILMSKLDISIVLNGDHHAPSNVFYYRLACLNN